MNPEINNQNNTPTNSTNQSNAPVNPEPQVSPQPTLPPQNNFAHKAWNKIKVAAIILIASCVLGLLLLPASYSYTVENTSLSGGLLVGLYAFSALLQLFLLVVGIKLLKKDWAIAVLASIKRRALYIIPLGLSMLFVAQWSKFANLLAFVLLMFAIMDLKKAGIITSYKQ